MQWLRHRSWLRHRDSEFAPGTQHLALLAAIGWLLCIVGACIWAVLIAKTDRRATIARPCEIRIEQSRRSDPAKR